MGKWKHDFSHHVAEDNAFEPGLRSYLEYRDLGIKDATRGEVVAHVIRAKEGKNATGQWHCHDCDFQMYYVIRGWLKFEYEDNGIHVARAGDCVLQPPGIKHREMEHSENLELIEIVSPADFETRVVDAPESAVEAAD